MLKSATSIIRQIIVFYILTFTGLVSADVEFDVLYDSSVKFVCSARNLTYDSQVIMVNGFKSCSVGNSSDFTRQGPITAKSLYVIMDGKVTTFAVVKMNGLLDENSQVIAPSRARLQLSLIPSLTPYIAPQTSNSYNIPGNYSIGNKGPAGGIVYYVDSTGQHGLEAQPADYKREDGYASCPDCNYPDGSLVHFYNWNEAVIVAQSYGAGWHLPTQDELNLLYQQRTVVGGFVSSGIYWSSTESNANYAWGQYFYVGYQSQEYKNYGYIVRAVRAF